VTLPAGEGPGLEALIDLHSDGLAAFRLRLADGEEAAVPPASGSGGQYCIVVAGTAELDGRALDRLSLVFVAPDEPAPALRATADGTEILVLQFPVEDGPARGKRRQ
jgi:hypothetical protein